LGCAVHDHPPFPTRRSSDLSNAIGLVPGSASGSWGYRRELKGQGKRLLQLLPASLLGAVCGAWLLLHLPPSVFRFIVPFLLILRSEEHTSELQSRENLVCRL